MIILGHLNHKRKCIPLDKPIRNILRTIMERMGEFDQVKLKEEGMAFIGVSL
jgi:hypothetical protein